LLKNELATVEARQPFNRDLIMRLLRVFVLLVPFTHALVTGNAQQLISLNKTQTLAAIDTLAIYKPVSNPFPVKGLFLPVAMIIYGFNSLENPTIQSWDDGLKTEVFLERSPKPLHIDNFLQFAPAVAVYGLNLAGVKGKHNFRDRTMIYLLSNMIMGATVYSAKHFSSYTRPDGSNNLSFPSGHTAEAFTSAEFLRQEYKDVSPWYGVAGYAVATATGYLRIYNNRHWLSDVIGGAGIGMASTKIAYWLYPKIQRAVFKDKPVNTLIMPSFQNGSPGISLVHQF